MLYCIEDTAGKEMSGGSRKVIVIPIYEFIASQCYFSVCKQLTIVTQRETVVNKIKKILVHTNFINIGRSLPFFRKENVFQSKGGTIGCSTCKGEKNKNSD